MSSSGHQEAARGSWAPGISQGAAPHHSAPHPAAPHPAAPHGHAGQPLAMAHLAAQALNESLVSASSIDHNQPAEGRHHVVNASPAPGKGHDALPSPVNNWASNISDQSSDLDNSRPPLAAHTISAAHSSSRVGIGGGGDAITAPTAFEQYAADLDDSVASPSLGFAPAPHASRPHQQAPPPAPTPPARAAQPKHAADFSMSSVSELGGVGGGGGCGSMQVWGGSAPQRIALQPASPTMKAASPHGMQAFSPVSASTLEDRDQSIKPFRAGSDLMIEEDLSD